MALTAAQRKAAFRECGKTLRGLAEDLKISHVHLLKVLRGERRSPRVEAAIAAALKLPVDEVFKPRDHQAA